MEGKPKQGHRPGPLPRSTLENEVILHLHLSPQQQSDVSKHYHSIGLWAGLGNTKRCSHPRVLPSLRLHVSLRTSKCRLVLESPSVPGRSVSLSEPCCATAEESPGSTQKRPHAGPSIQEQGRLLCFQGKTKARAQFNLHVPGDLGPESSPAHQERAEHSPEGRSSPRAWRHR